MNIIKKIPIPIAGVALALASLGNIYMKVNPLLRHVFMIPAIITIILLTIKFIILRDAVKENLQNPVVASVLLTYSMAIMIISTYIKTFNPTISLYVWYLAIAIHLALVVWFTYTFIYNFQLKRFFPSYFIVYAGIVVASVTAPAFNNLRIGQYLFWFGFVTYMIVLPIVIYRLYKHRDIPTPAIPTLVIFTAPSNLCLAGYLTSFQDKNTIVVSFLILLAYITYAYALINIPRVLKLKFYPSYSGLTFPTVISAIATKKLYLYTINMSDIFAILNYLYIAQLMLATCLTLYVACRYILFIKEKVVAE